MSRWLDEGDIYIVLLCLFLASIIFAIDMLVPLGVAAAVPYVLVVGLSIYASKPGLEFYIAGLCLVLTFLGYALSPDGGEQWKVLANRGLAIGLTVFSALLIHRRRKIIFEMMQLNKNLNDLSSNLEAQVARRTYELAEQKTMMDEVLETTDVAFMLVTPMGEIKLINRAACAILGCEPNAVIGWNIKNFIRAEYETDIHYILTIAKGQKPRRVTGLKASDNKGNIITVDVEARTTKSEATDIVLLSMHRNDDK